MENITPSIQNDVIFLKTRLPWCVIKNHYRDFLVFKDTFVMMCYKKPFSRFSCLKTSYVDLLSKSITLRKIEKFESFQQHFRHFFLPLSVSPSCFPLSLLLSKEWINKLEICCPVPYHRQCCPKSSSVGNNGHSCQSLIVRIHSQQILTPVAY